MFAISVLGCGRIGKMHAGIIASLPGCRLSAVYDPVAAAAAEVAQAHSCQLAQTAEEAILAGDAVLIATSTPTHADLIELAIKHGKAVFCEKPIDLSIDRVRQLRRNIGDAQAAKVQIGFQRRFDPGCRAAREALVNGEIGELHQVIITTRDPRPAPYEYFKASGGIFRDMVIHDFDLARFYLGEDPTEIFAIANVLVDKKIGSECNDHDTTMVILRAASGKQCHINNSRSAAYGYDQRVELFGSGGMLVAENQTEHNLRRYTPTQTGIGTRFMDFFIERYRDAYRDSIISFVDSVRNGTVPISSFEDGEKALCLSEAAYQSLRERRMVPVTY